MSPKRKHAPEGLSNFPRASQGGGCGRGWPVSPPPRVGVLSVAGEKHVPPSRDEHRAPCPPKSFFNSCSCPPSGGARGRRAGQRCVNGRDDRHSRAQPLRTARSAGHQATRERGSPPNRPTLCTVGGGLGSSARRGAWWRWGVRSRGAGRRPGRAWGEAGQRSGTGRVAAFSGTSLLPARRGQLGSPMPRGAQEGSTSRLGGRIRSLIQST